MPAKGQSLANKKQDALRLFDQAQELVESNRVPEGIVLLRAAAGSGFDDAERYLQSLIVSGIVGQAQIHSDANQENQLGSSGRTSTDDSCPDCHGMLSGTRSTCWTCGWLREYLPKYLPEAISLESKSTSTSHRLKEKAEGGDVESMYLLGVRFFQKGRVDEAAFWLGQAGSQEHMTAAYFTGLAQESRQDFESAEEWYRFAAGSGDLRYVAGAGRFFLRRKQYELAREVLHQAVTWGHPASAYDLAIVELRTGHWDEADRWFDVAAKAGVIEAAFRLAVMAHTVGDLESSEGWMRYGAEKGNVECLRFVKRWAREDRRIRAKEQKAARPASTTLIGYGMSWSVDIQEDGNADF